MVLIVPPRHLLLGVLLPGALALAACAGPAAGGPAAGDRPSVVTALYPLAFVAEHVGGEDIVVTNLAAPGIEPHDLELSPQQVGAIADAALVLHLDGFAPAVDEATAQNAAGRALDVGTVLPLIEATADDEHGHAADETHEEGESDEHGTLDPHFWLDPSLLADLADEVGARLGEIDPDNADAYADRAAGLITELDRLDAEFEQGLATCETRTIITAHAAFGYLAQRYDLEQFSVAGLEPDAEPSAARIAEVHTRVAADAVTTLYFEPLANPDVVDAIADDLDLDTAELDPIESIDADAGADYFTAMASNLASLRLGQGCS